MFSENAIKVLEKRYLLRDMSGNLTESPEGLFERVARCVVQAEERFGASKEKVDSLYESFRDMLLNREFLPNSPTLMNAGKPKGQLSACFVLPIPDSLEGIFESCKNAALIHKTGGGTGFSFSRLRPANDPVASSTGVASGPVSFMGVFDAATEAIRQGGTRRGANMGMLRIDHPDIEKFITAKRDTNKLNNFNISVAVTDAFMQALANGEDYELLHPRSGKAVDKVSAQKVFSMIVENAHATGEPGIVFIDRINHSDPIRQATDESGEIIAGTEDIEATNPCGEQPLGPGDACNLGSINLSVFVDEASNSFDWPRLEKCIRLAVQFLDDVIEVNCYPLPFIAKATLNNRRIGLGVMGWAEALIKLGIPYDTQEAIDCAREIMMFFNQTARQRSIELAEERGVFPNWQHTVWSDGDIRLRNATVTTIAPTGTISMIAGTSSGIEPIFAVTFLRRVLGGMELIDVNPLFEQIARERGFYSQELMQKIAEEGTVAHIEEIPEDVRRVWVCAHDIAHAWHVKMQAAFQDYTDNAVSKTINFPESASVDDIRSVYMMAWELGLKGITVYRDASRRSQVLNIKKTDPLAKEKMSPLASESVASATQKETTLVGRPEEPTAQGDAKNHEKIKKFSSPLNVGTAFSPLIRGSFSFNIRREYTHHDRDLVVIGSGARTSIA
ncbi:MAG: adenosylcobalamin-dependent ribonucleoside-diphosphate reductase, partial [Cyanobacteria bacterium]|nr:adenosylcobalamin-dependent ribonucleoside-diphosphate reductase [Cyanobacteriota bacterium]